jgi:hypothetical protein
MNIVRTVVPFAMAIVCAGCTVNSGDSGDSETVDTAEERLSISYFPPGVGGDDILQTTFDYINDVEVDDVSGHSFTTSGSVNFLSIQGLPWNATNVAKCTDSYIWVTLTKWNGSSWVQWVNVGYVYATATQSQLGTILSCKASWSNPSTPFVSSSKFNIYQSQVAGDGSSGQGYSRIVVHQDS